MNKELVLSDSRFISTEYLKSSFGGFKDSEIINKTLKRCRDNKQLIYLSDLPTKYQLELNKIIMQYRYEQDPISDPREKPRSYIGIGRAMKIIFYDFDASWGLRKQLMALVLQRTKSGDCSEDEKRSSLENFTRNLHIAEAA